MTVLIVFLVFCAAIGVAKALMPAANCKHCGTPLKTATTGLAWSKTCSKCGRDQ